MSELKPAATTGSGSNRPLSLRYSTPTASPSGPPGRSNRVPDRLAVASNWLCRLLSFCSNVTKLIICGVIDPKPPNRLNGTQGAVHAATGPRRSEEHTSELQSRQYLVCRLLLEKKKNMMNYSAH